MRDHRGIEIRPNLNDGLSAKADDPAVARVESQAILCGCQRAEFDDRLIVFEQDVFDDELHTLRQDPFRIGATNQLSFGAILASQRMGSFNDPVDVVGDMVEKFVSIAILQPRKIWRT
jgi:hypothetical protein